MTGDFVFQRSDILISILLLFMLLSACNSASAPTPTTGFSPTAALTTQVVAAPTQAATPTATARVTVAAPTLQPTETLARSIPIDQQVDNLVAFAHLYGIVRYFHPSDQVADFAKWDDLLRNGVDQVQMATDSAELSTQLTNMFAPLAPTLVIFSAESPPATPLAQPNNSNNLNIVMWEHKGVQADNNGEIYSSTRVVAALEEGSVPENFVAPSDPYIFNLGSGLSAAIPLALFTNENGTFPQDPTDSSTLGALSMDQSDTTRFIANQISYWTMIKHFYPYLDVINVAWDATLAQAIERTLRAENQQEQQAGLQWLVAQAGDGHGYLVEAAAPILYVPNLVTAWIDGQLVIVRDLRDSAESIPPGAVVTEVDGKRVAEQFAATYELTSAATVLAREQKAAATLLEGAQTQPAMLTLTYEGDPIDSVEAERTELVQQFNNFVRPEPAASLADGLMYVDLTRIDDAAWPDVLSQVETARGIIFDLRGYPNISPVFMQHLIESPIASAPFLVPTYRLPNQQNVSFFNGAWELPNAQPTLTNNIVFLTNSQAISYGETLMGMVDHYALGTIVGTATAGTNGNVNRIHVSSNQTIFWTGMKVVQHDGSQLHGIGIRPDVPVYRTVEGVASERDEQLEAAIEIVLERMP